MKPLGHLRRAWLGLQEAIGEVDAIKRYEPWEGDVNAALVELHTVAARLHPVLAAAEMHDNDNGETALEYARDARAALGRYDYCLTALARITETPRPGAGRDAAKEIEALDQIIASLGGTP